MRFTRFAITAALSCAIIACSDEPAETEEVEEATETEKDEGQFGQDVTAPPPSSWADEGFSDDGGESDPSFTDDEVTSPEGLR